MKKIFFLMIIPILIWGCDSLIEPFVLVYSSIRFENQSKENVLIWGGYILPDTLLPVSKPKLKEVSIGKRGNIYDDDVNDPKFKRLSTDRLTIFVLSKDTINKYDWDTARNKNMILKRYEFNEKEILEMGGYDIIYR
jgi:hypothetical protein